MCDFVTRSYGMHTVPLGPIGLQIGICIPYILLSGYNMVLYPTKKLNVLK